MKSLLILLAVSFMGFQAHSATGLERACSRAFNAGQNFNHPRVKICVKNAQSNGYPARLVRRLKAQADVVSNDIGVNKNITFLLTLAANASPSQVRRCIRADQNGSENLTPCLAN